MSRVIVHIAQPIGGRLVPALDIVGDEPFPDRTGDEVLWDLEQRFDIEAAVIVDALHASLPGGTWDRVVARMVQVHATLLVVKR